MFILNTNFDSKIIHLAGVVRLLLPFYRHVFNNVSY